MRYEKGVKYYTREDEILRLEMREIRPKLDTLPRLVAILNIAGKELTAELRPNLNRCGIEGGDPITQAFEGFLRKHRLMQAEEPLLAGKRKKHVVAYVRRPPPPSPGVHVLCCNLD
jgi:hypothetical protein